MAVVLIGISVFRFEIAGGGVRIIASNRLEFTRGRMPSLDSVVHSDPEILGGTPVFQGTRVPLRNLIDCLERGHTLDEFLDSFPSVSRNQAVAALEAAHEALNSRARSSR
jgi:uncharacterized protein (DUF433 family)